MSDTFNRNSVLKLAFEELERARFLRTINDKIAVRVGNDSDAPLYVIPLVDESALPISIYDNAPTVSKLVPTLVNEYIVPPTKILELQNIEASGENTAKYIIEIDGQVNKVKYTYYGASLNVDFIYNNLRLIAGQVIRVFVEHYVNDTPVDFHATIEGRLINE